jgi:hypothetical protein
MLYSEVAHPRVSNNVSTAPVDVHIVSAGNAEMLCSSRAVAKDRDRNKVRRWASVKVNNVVAKMVVVYSRGSQILVSQLLSPW